MQANVPELDVQRAGLAAISVGQVGIGPLQIGELVIDNADFSMSAGLAQFRNMRVTVTLVITLEWRIRIPLPIIDDIDEGDTINVGQPSFTVNLGNVTVPGLNNINAHIPNLTAGGLAVSLSPLNNLQLGAATAEQIRARNVVLPSQGFQLAGLTLDSLQGSAISVPAGSVGEVTIGRVHGGAAPISQMALSGVALPAASIPDITSQALDITAVPSGRTFNMDAGILRLSLRINPSARSRIAQLRLTNVNASASVGQIVLRNVVFPFEVLNLTLSQVGIETIEIPAFAVS